jgi:nitric oxide reductase NorQ protein
MVAIELNYPDAETEVRVIMQEAQIEPELAQKLVRLGRAIRGLEHEGLPEGASTRTLIAAARLIKDGLPPIIAADTAIAGPLTDDPAASENLRKMAAVYMA